MPATSSATTDDLTKVMMSHHAAISSVSAAAINIVKAILASKRGDDANYDAGLDTALDELAEGITALKQATADFARVSQKLSAT